jgi:hypothetical protein
MAIGFDNSAKQSAPCVARLAVIMVGLPASGKSFTSRSIARYLRWLGYETKTFSAALYRQKMFGTAINADFFNVANANRLEERTKVAEATLTDMIAYLCEEASLCTGVSNSCGRPERIAIMDASNTIRERRAIIAGRLRENGISCVFVECVYGKDDLLHEHLQYLHILSPDYANMQPGQAAADYRQRIQFYLDRYDKLEPSEGAIVRLVNGGERLEMAAVSGFLPSKVVYFLMNLKCQQRRIFLKPSGDVLAEGTDARKLSNSIRLWCGPDAAMDLKCATVKSQLAGINLSSEYEGLDEAEIKKRRPEDYKLFLAHSYKHRYPRSESYADVARRLETIIMELEGSDSDIFIIADISVIRCIYSYYVETSNPNNIPHLKFDQAETVELCPLAYGCFETRYKGLEPSRERIFRPYLDDPPANNTSPKLIPRPDAV